MDSLPVIVIGAGGHAKVVIGALLAAKAHVVGATDIDSRRWQAPIMGIKVIGDDSALDSYKPDDLLLANGVGSTDLPEHRVDIFDGLRERGFRFVSVKHPSAIVAPETSIGEGTQILAGAILQPGYIGGANVVVNTGAQIDHDCTIDDHVHIAPGAIIGGNVNIRRGAFIGMGAAVLPGLTIGPSAIVGAGAVVRSDVPERSTVVGVPARPIHN